MNNNIHEMANFMAESADADGLRHKSNLRLYGYRSNKLKMTQNQDDAKTPEKPKDSEKRTALSGLFSSVKGVGLHKTKSTFLWTSKLNKSMPEKPKASEV
eukprot:CAMPEP_0184329842 /NCGR_PEP_ID=MMETSP1049-20130417/144363_1 /TAXON_ID=77928 /ORGANISM="Proteomonas sulcata, Strain CCMP704" /LENGTH=99 /DNA_ID=CAMNT_0026652233 /DNA_START=521 /DNA_END=820 /DNA_ORIENTATION=-